MTIRGFNKKLRSGGLVFCCWHDPHLANGLRYGRSCLGRLL